MIYCQSFEDTEAAAIAEILRKALETVTIRSAKGDFGITASFGVATSRNPDERIEETIARADTLLYRAKKSGRNRIETAHSDEIITEPAYYQKGAYTTKPEISNRRTNWIKTLRSLF